jgi:hypothetical protein
MVASRCCLRALALLLLAAPALAQPHAELTWLLDSGNLIGKAAPTAPPWEGLDGIRSGRDNRARLVLAGEHAGVVPGVQTRAVLRLDLPLDDAGQDGPIRLRDASSWLGVAWRLQPAAELSFRAFPLDTDYLRLGYLHALDWGGSDVSRLDSAFLQQAGGAKGAELALRGRHFRLFSWLKWASLENAASGPRRVWGAAGGGSFELGPWLRVEAGFGAFQRPPTFLEGASLRLVLHRGAQEPELAAEPFRPPSLRADGEGLTAEASPGFAVALEAVTLVTRQRRYEDPRLQTLTPAPAIALYGSLRQKRWSAHGVLGWRSLPFVLRNDPRAVPEQALPARALWQPELSAWLGGSFVAPLGLSPSAELGLRLPAALQVPSVLPGYAQTFLAQGVAGFEALPTGSGRLPVVAARLALRWQASAMLGLSALVEYQRDPNRTMLLSSPAGLTRGFADSDSLGVLGAAQARF